MRLLLWVGFIIFWIFAVLIGMIGVVVAKPFEYLAYGTSIIANWFGVRLLGNHLIEE